MPADVDQIRELKSALHKYSLSTGLKINYGKSHLIPINVPEDLAIQLAAEFGCQVGSTPFTYLVCCWVQLSQESRICPPLFADWKGS
jgi:hypothetical protein